MKILLICPYPPYPVLSGGHTRIFNIIKQLAKSNQISLLAYNREPVTDEQHQVLGKYCQRQKFIPRPPIWSITNLLRYLFSADPFIHIINGRNKRVTQAIEEEVENFKPDLIHVEHYQIAGCLLQAKAAPKVPRLLGSQGVEFLILERMARVGLNPIKRLAGMIEAARIRPFEIGICNQFDSCVEVSEDDKMIIEKAGVKTPVMVAINGVDLNYFSPGPWPAGRPSIIFIATFKFFGNVDAAGWLVNQVWPLIKRQNPRTQFYIVGNGPPAWLKNTTDPNILVTGWVEDIRDYINKSQIVVAPLRMGSGTKLKVLEAMAMARPVVTTWVGAEGIGAKEGQHLLIRDDPRSFAQAVNELLIDEDKARSMGQQAQKFIADNYSWEKTADQLSKAYKSAIARKKGTGK